MGLLKKMALGIGLIFFTSHHVYPIQQLRSLYNFFKNIPGAKFVTGQVAVQKEIIKIATIAFDNPFYGPVKKAYHFSKIVFIFNLIMLGRTLNQLDVEDIGRLDPSKPFELLNKDPFKYAVEYEDIFVLKQLARNGFDFSATTVDKGMMDDLARENKAKILDFLIKAGASVHVSDTGSFPIYKAMLFESRECIKLLGRAGDVIKKTKDNLPEDFEESALEIVRDMEKSTQELMSAIETQNVSKAKRAIDSWAIVVRKDQFGNTLLHKVIGPYDPKKPTSLDQIARLIVPTIGCQVRKLRNDKEQTPLHIAAMQGNIRLMQLLVRFGADVDSPDIFGNTPSHYAHDLSTVLFLKHNHADLSIQNDKGELPYQALIELVQLPRADSIGTKFWVYNLFDNFKSIFTRFSGTQKFDALPRPLYS
jgi:hypothetical protein